MEQTLYRTGDRSVYSADGTIRCLGRLDCQIKIQGYRIEPGEIESVMRRYCCDGDAASGNAADSDDREISRQSPDRSKRHHPGNNPGKRVCTRCLLSDRHPGVTVEQGICSVCRRFERDKQHIDRYFKCEADFHRLMAQARLHKRLLLISYYCIAVVRTAPIPYFDCWKWATKLTPSLLHS